LLPEATRQAADIDLQRGADWWQGWSGYNLVSLAKLQIYRGLLADDESLVSQGFHAVWAQLVTMSWPPPAPSALRSAACNSSTMAARPCIPGSCQVGGGSYLGDGIQADGSFHQHGAQLLSGAYGEGLTSAILDFLPVGESLKWQVQESALRVFAQLVLGQARMTLPGKVWDWQVCGRGCTCSGGRAVDGLRADKLQYAATLYTRIDPQLQQQLLDFAKEQQGASATQPRTGSFSYFRSDYLLHRRAGWSASWKGRSNRTVAARCVNSDSKMSADTGEGSTFVYRSSDAGSAHAGIWPVIDWQKYPGSTVQQGELQPCNWAYKYDFEPTFVGSVSDGLFGASAQDIAQNNGFKARRSWLFADNGIASMISHESVDPKTVKDHPPAYTTIANERFSGKGIWVKVHGTVKNPTPEVLPFIDCELTDFNAPSVMAVWHNHTTYLISAAGGRVQVHCGELTGNWSRISSNHGTVTVNTFRLQFQHSFPTDWDRYGNRTDGVKSEFSYVVLPNTEMVNGDIVVPEDIARNTSGRDESVHVMTNASGGVASIVFWEEDGGAASAIALSAEHPAISVSASSACLVLVTQGATPAALTVTVSSPDRPSTTVTLKVSVPGASKLGSTSGGGCALSAAGGLEVQLPAGETSGNSTTCEVTLARGTV
jgi:hypothetical protein